MIFNVVCQMIIAINIILEIYSFSIFVKNMRITSSIVVFFYLTLGGRHGRDCDRMVVGFITACATSAYHH
jgi:hypothetical protein